MTFFAAQNGLGGSGGSPPDPPSTFDVDLHSPQLVIDPSDQSGWTIVGGKATIVRGIEAALRTVNMSGDGLAVVDQHLVGDGSNALLIGQSSVENAPGVCTFGWIVKPIDFGNNRILALDDVGCGFSLESTTVIGVHNNYYAEVELNLPAAMTAGNKYAILVVRDGSDNWIAHTYDGTSWQTSSNTENMDTTLTFESGDEGNFSDGELIYYYSYFKKNFTGTDLDDLKAHMEAKYLSNT